jgi:hypothetical protein
LPCRPAWTQKTVAKSRQRGGNCPTKTPTKKKRRSRQDVVGNTSLPPYPWTEAESWSPRVEGNNSSKAGTGSSSRRRGGRRGRREQQRQRRITALGVGGGGGSGWWSLGKGRCRSPRWRPDPRPTIAAAAVAIFSGWFWCYSIRFGYSRVLGFGVVWI